MKDRRPPFLLIAIIVVIVGTLIAAMTADAPAPTTPTQVEVTLPAGNDAAQ